MNIDLSCPYSWHIQRRLDELEKTLEPLQQKRDATQRQLATALSCEFIEKYKLRSEDIELSTGDDEKFFWILDNFAHYMRTISLKQWGEWNGIIYHAADIMRGQLPDMPGRIKDLHDLEK
jgi:hypothetical protein